VTTAYLRDGPAAYAVVTFVRGEKLAAPTSPDDDGAASQAHRAVRAVQAAGVTSWRSTYCRIPPLR
jgi:hypothetical protein